MNNPYTNRGTIKNPLEFYGREREIRRIFSRISSSHPQCISIIGERKIGKSSLLYFLNHEDTRKKWLKNPESYVFLLIDLQERTEDLSFSSFFQFIFRSLTDQLGTDVVPSSALDSIGNQSESYEVFKNIVSNIGKSGFKLIILFDEFGAITSSERFDPTFFSYLRSIANNYECAYITTSRLKLQNLCRSTDISESPFFNIFAPVPLGQFSLDEARSLIFTPLKQSGVEFNEHEANFILSIAGCYPLFIQMACSAMFDHKIRDGGISHEVDFDAVTADFLMEASGQFDVIWSEMDEGRQKVLCKVALSDKVEVSEQYLVRDLQRSGYLMENPVAPFSQAFRDFLLAKQINDVSLKAVNQIAGDSKKRASFSSRIKDIFKRGQR